MTEFIGLSIDEPLELRFGERNDRETALTDQRGIGEEFVGFDVGQCSRLLQFVTDFNLDCFINDREDGGGANGLALIAGVINDETVALLHA